MACHHWISVTANAGEENPITAAAAASCMNLNGNFTIKPLANLGWAAWPVNACRGFGARSKPRKPFCKTPVPHTIDDHPGVGTIAASRLHCKKGIEPFPSAVDSIIKGKKLSVYRADLPRTLALVVALSLTAVAT